MLTRRNDANTLEIAMSIDHRQGAQAHVERLLTLMRASAEKTQLESLIGECESLSRAIAAFHIEAIRFRMFNVDRLLTRGGLPVPAEAAGIFVEVRHELEAAGFHTRSHQAPPTATA
jgi:hypothetical protein